MKRLYLVFVVIMASQLAVASSGKPLLMANKKNLYQRILTLPNAVIYPQAKVIQNNAKPLPVFSIYYVYSRETINNQKWLKVGLGRYGTKLGWIQENKTLDWSQRLTLTFRDPEEGQDRVLLFKDKKSAERLVTSSNRTQYNRVYQAAVEEKELVNSPVVAIQPAENIDIRKNFYLVPIHGYDDIFMKSSTARLLQVSSIPLKDEDKIIKSKKKAVKVKKVAVNSPYPSSGNSGTDYAAGITFVVDATLSMQPYIDRTRKVVKKIFTDIKRANLLGDVSFGLVAYRDNINAAPNIEYVTKQYVSLKQGKDPDRFMRKVAGLSATRFSSKDFVEDGFSGIYKAIEEMDWSPFAARYIVMITDAGSRTANDPLSSTGVGLEKLRRLAKKKNIAIFVMHLLTPDSLANHKSAREQYKVLSEYPGIGSFYYGVPTGDTGKFGKVIESLSTQITSQVGQMKRGSNVAETKPETDPEVSELRDLQSKVEQLGYALRMRFLNKRRGEQAPDVFKAWLVDKDFNDPEKRTVDVRVLLTRNQLSDLYIILKQVLDTAEKGVISPTNFLNELKSLAVTTSRDPTQLGGTTATTAGAGHSLAELGFMREYIEGLPYTGEVMNLSLDDWQSWSVKRQIKFLQGLEHKINYYRNLHDHIDLWVSLKGGSIDGDSVFPVPLDMLP